MFGLRPKHASSPKEPLKMDFSTWSSSGHVTTQSSSGHVTTQSSSGHVTTSGRSHVALASGVRPSQESGRVHNLCQFQQSINIWTVVKFITDIQITSGFRKAFSLAEFPGHCPPHNSHNTTTCFHCPLCVLTWASLGHVLNLYPHPTSHRTRDSAFTGDKIKVSVEGSLHQHISSSTFKAMFKQRLTSQAADVSKKAGHLFTLTSKLCAFRWEKNILVKCL